MMAVAGVMSDRIMSRFYRKPSQLVYREQPRVVGKGGVITYSTEYGFSKVVISEERAAPFSPTAGHANANVQDRRAIV